MAGRPDTVRAMTCGGWSVACTLPITTEPPSAAAAAKMSLRGLSATAPAGGSRRRGGNGRLEGSPAHLHEGTLVIDPVQRHGADEHVRIEAAVGREVGAFGPVVEHNRRAVEDQLRRVRPGHLGQRPGELRAEPLRRGGVQADRRPGQLDPGRAVRDGDGTQAPGAAQRAARCARRGPATARARPAASSPGPSRAPAAPSGAAPAHPGPRWSRWDRGSRRTGSRRRAPAVPS